jgi:hypothetical protein
MNIPAKQNDIKKEAEYLIIIEWDRTSHNDIDLWVRNPKGNIVSFTRKGVDFMHLERDDLGIRNDSIMGSNGVVVEILRNEEVVTLRGTQVGEYEVMAHIYNVRKQASTKTITVRVIQINPYKVRYQHVYKFQSRGQHISLLRFEIGDDNKWISFNNERSDFIPIVGSSAQ